MLVKCPECELQISDKAISCPHCGIPIQPEVRRKTTKRSKNKRRRLPNGFGQISEIKGRNLRNPFQVMVTVGKNSQGRPICKLLKPKGFFATYNEAYEALVEYHKNPYDLDEDITVRELYEKWYDEYSKNVKESGLRTIRSAWSYCSTIYDMRAKDVRARHIKGCMDEGHIVFRGEVRYASASTKTKIKSLFNLMLDYAYEYEIVDRNYARTFDISTDVLKEMDEMKNAHISFTNQEMEKLWEYADKMQYVDVILIQCYSGWRPQELGLIRLDNVDLEEWTFMGGMKTQAGTNRTVPLHPKIREFVERLYHEAEELGSEYLINCTDTKTHRSSLNFTYDKYAKRFAKIRDVLKLNPDHRPHDGRKHFITMAKKANVDEYAIKYLVGHNISDITEKVYTDRDMEWLKEEILKIE